MREDERGGIKKRQKRRKGTRKEKSSKNDRGTQTTLSGRLRGSSATRRDNDSGSRKDQAKEKKRSGKEETSRKKTRRQCVVAWAMSKGVKMTSVTWNCSRRESFHNLRLIHITWGNYWSTDFLRNNRLRWLRLWWTKRQVLLRKTLSLAEKLFLFGL